mmetsp:Transcript_5067/g.4564  ORF Transcript_5067/g.4564 Transcript_5067/m.4564 type:complete len:90 (+) Transcript_5067:92-361(+)
MYTTIVKQSLKLNINKLLINNNKNLINRSLSGHGESHNHEHHEHLLFEGPFSKRVVGGLIASGFVVGSGLIVFACYFQNLKHGFLKKKE